LTPPESAAAASSGRSPSRDAAAAQRVAARQARRSLDPTTRSQAETSIGALVASLDELQGPGRIGWYHAADGEVDLAAQVAALRQRGWQVFLPVIGPAYSMRFMAWEDGGRLEANRHGILEPVVDPRAGAAGPVTGTDPVADSTVLVDAAMLDVIVVPCVAVDPAGHRLGFGAGYYDRALADARDIVRLGAVFEVQLVDRIDPAPWDVPLDVIVTEERVIRPGR